MQRKPMPEVLARRGSGHGKRDLGRSGNHVGSAEGWGPDENGAAVVKGRLGCSAQAGPGRRFSRVIALVGYMVAVIAAVAAHRQAVGVAMVMPLVTWVVHWVQAAAC